MIRSAMTVAPVLLLVLATGPFLGNSNPRVFAQGQKEAEPGKLALTCPDPHKGNRPRLDAHGDPLPEGAIARLGTVRFRHGYLHSGLAFSADGKSIVASDYYGGVQIWDAADGRELRKFCETDYYSHGLAVSPDGKSVAVAVGNLTVRLFDPNTGVEIGAFPKDREQLNHIVFSNDGTLLAASGGNWSVRVYDVATRQ